MFFKPRYFFVDFCAQLQLKILFATMKLLYALFLSSFFSFHAFAQTDSAFIRNIYNEALERGQCYSNLNYLCKNIGNRITGSAEAEMAIYWGERVLKSYGFDKVYLQKISVPHWERGTTESAWIINEKGDFLKVNVLALGGSVGTNGLLEQEVLVVANIEELKKLKKSAVEGKIVYLGQAFDAKNIRTFVSYGQCGIQRWSGASEAAKLGAVGLVIRSLGSEIDDFPHTGSLGYEEGVAKIPAAAISTQDCNTLEEWAKMGKIKVRMEMDCRWYENTTSYNVVGEMTGTKSDQIITWGGHLDSWDVGEGAHDDGAGIVHSIEALRILKALGYKPNYTLRCVLFMNEENGNFGGKGYATQAKAAGERHIAAIESDRGGFLPLGFDIKGTQTQVDFVQEIATILRKDFHLYTFKPGGSGTDIGPLIDEYPDMLQLGLAVNSQEYFKYHHTAADVFEAVNQRELELGSAAMAAMIYLLDQHLLAEELKN